MSTPLPVAALAGSIGAPVYAKAPVQATSVAPVINETVRPTSPGPHQTVVLGQSEFRALELQIQEERSMRLQLQMQVQSLAAELAYCRRRLDKLDPPETPIRTAVRLVESRGNVRVNHSTGHVTLMRPIAFVPRTTKDAPNAVFAKMEAADAICKDLAELSNIFNSPMTIEGHTKGGESDFWQCLANDRARIVAEKIVQFGADPYLLRTQGLPGRMGKNEVRTEVYMDLANIRIENAPVYERDIIVGGKVVERDFIQGGKVVERDIVKPSVKVVERDFYQQGGRLYERDIIQQGPPVVERELVGLSGTVVERNFSPPARIVSAGAGGSPPSTARSISTPRQAMVIRSST